jgi:hypothetical protein
MCDTNKNVIKMGVIKKGITVYANVYYSIATKCFSLCITCKCGD